MPKLSINFSPEDVINALEDYAKKTGSLKASETLETIKFNYDNNNDVESIDGITQ